MRCLALALAASLLGNPGFAASCQIKPLQTHGSTIKFNGYSVQLLQPDHWNGVLSWEVIDITDPAGDICIADTQNVTAPYYLAGTHVLYFTTYGADPMSLTNTQVVIDADSCKIAWISPYFISLPELVSGDTFNYQNAGSAHVGPSCLPA